MVNVIDEIFSQLDNSGLLDISAEGEQNEKLNFLKDLSLRVAIFDSCIFSHVVSAKDNENESFVWYNIFHFNPTSQEIIESKQKTAQFLTSFGVQDSKINGLVYELVDLGVQKSSSNNFEYEVNELIKAFEQKADCRFFIWFQDFYDNVNPENQNILITKLATILKEYSKYSPAVLELILSRDPSTTASIAVSVFATREDFILTEESVTILESHLKQFDLTKESLLVKDYLKILIDNIVFAHTINPDHTIFLSQIISKEGFNSKFAKDIIDRFGLFLKSEDFKISLFPEEAFKNFETLISTSQDKDPLLALLGQAVIKDYYKISLDTFSHFEDLFNSNSYLKDLAFEVICSYLHDEFTSTSPDYDFIESKINHLLKSNHKLPKHLIQDVINSYVKDQNHFFLSLVDIIEQYYNKTNELLVDFGVNLVNIIKVSTTLSSQNIKDISFLLLRIAQAKVKLPEDTLSSITGFINSDDIYIKRVISKLYHTLDASFGLEANNFNYLKTPTSIDIEAFEKLNKIKVIERQLEILKVNNQFEIEDIAFILSHLQEDNQENFYWAIERIANYGLSTEIFDRDGYSVLDVFLKYQDASNWSKAVKRIYDDNNFFIEYNLNELLDKLKDLNTKQHNPKILKLLEKDEFNQNYFEKTFDQISKIEGTWIYNFVLCYDQSDILDQENTVYIYLETEKLFFKINNNITQITEDDNTQSIINSILNKQALNQDDIFYLSQKYGYYKDLKTWQKEDFIAWRVGVDEVNDDNIAQVLAVLKQAAFSSVFEHRYYPRMTQIITVLCMYKADHGILAQVTTGEGKSVIIDLFAALKVLGKHKVDIVNSSRELAKRDAKEQKSFYDMLGMSSGHNIVNTSGKKECYSYDVIYGDLGGYTGDDLRDIEFGTRAGRGYDIVIIDEVDNLLIDLKSMTVRLTSTTPGFFYLKEILAYLWSIYPNALSIGADKCHADEASADLTKCVEFLRETFTEFAKKNLLDFSIKRDESPVTLPNQLTQFSKDQLPKWVESLLDALTKYVKDIQYTVHGDASVESYSNTTSLARVAPVDFDNTGTVNANMQWSNGLHQFLSLLERTFLASENLVGLFMTYVAYVSKFKGNIYGLTGTLGIKTHTDFLAKFYDVDFVTIPTFKEKKLVIYPEIIVNTQEEWASFIVEKTKARAIQDSRPVLIIMKTIKQVEELYKILSEDEAFANFKIIQYVYGTEKERERIEEEEIENNTIIIATNLSGRGTDIKVNKIGEKNGGLHVILTYFPDNIRVLMQGFGRAARKGEFGSAELIIINELSSACDNIACLEDLRDKRELAKFKEEGTCRLPHIMTQDWLFAKFHEVFTNLNLPTGYKIVTDNNIKSEKNSLNKKQLYLSLDKTGIYLSGVDENGTYFTLKIDEELAQYDLDLTNHIRAILKANQSSISLNKQDLELVHFIAAKHGLNIAKDNIFSEIQAILGTWQDKCLNQIKHFNNIRNTANTENDQNTEKSIFQLQGKCDLDLLLSKDLVTYLKEHILNYKTGELTQVELDYFLYALWKRYLETYNKNPDIAQVKAIWEMWLYYQNELFEEFIYECDEHNQEQATALESELRGKLTKLFEVFAADIRARYNNISLFDNPKLLLDKAYLYNDIYHSPFHQITDKRTDASSNLMVQALEFTNTGIDLDDPLAFALYQARAIIRLIKSIEENIRNINEEDVGRANFFKEQTYKDLIEVLTRIRQTSAQQESVIMALAMMGLVEPGQDLMNQYVIQRELFSLCEESVVNATKVIESARYDQKIVLNGVLTLQDLASRINITESYNKTLSSLAELTNQDNSTNPYVARLFNTTALNQNLVSAKQNELIKTSTSEMVATFGFTPMTLGLMDLEEEEQDWTGTIFSAIAGIAQIFAAFAVIAIGGPFATSFGLSMLMSGIGDVMASIISVAENKPIDIDQYFKAKALTYAVAIITASIAQIGKFEFNGLDGNGKTQLLEKLKPTDMFVHGLKLTAANTIIGYGVGAVANKIIDSNNGDAEKEANEAASWLVGHYQAQLQLIFIADELDTEEDIFYELAISASSTARDCAGRFNDIPSNLGQSTFAAAASLGGSMWGAAAASVGGAALGLIKYNEFAGEFKEKYGEVIISQANYARNYLKQDGSSKMMYKALAKIWHLSQSNLAMDELMQAGFIDTNNNIDYSKCNNIGNYDASIFQAIDRESLIKVCNEIYLAYLNYSNSLEKTIAQNLNSAMTNTLKQDVAKPILMQAGYFLYNEFSNWFDNLKQKNTKEKEDSASGDNDPEPANDNDGGRDKDNKNNKDNKDNKKSKDLKDNEAKKTVFKLVKETNEPEVIIDEAQNNPEKAKHKNLDEQLYNTDGSSKGSCPGDGPGVCSTKGYRQEAENANVHKQTTSLTFKEFENHVVGELEIEKGDTGITDYIKEKYQEYLVVGQAEVSNFGLQMHKGGLLLDAFKKDNPNLSKGIKLAVDTTGKAVGIIVDGTIYVLSPLKPVWEVYRDAVNALVPDVINEWVGNKEKQAGEGLKNWEKGLTSKQKLVLDTSIEGAKFVGDVTLVGGAVKLVGTAGKLIIEDTLKVVTKVDKPNIKAYGEANPYVDNYHSTNYHQSDLDSLGKLPGPELPALQTSTYASGFNNRLLKADEHFYRYHGVDNLSGKKYSYFTNKKYNCEIELRSGLGIEDSWGIDITKVTEVKVPAGNWISEGVAGSQSTYKGGDYQAVLSNVPKQWIVKTEKAFKNE